MMRELTKSTLSAGLAMSLFGMQAMMNVFRRPRMGEPNPTVETLDAVTQAMVDHSGDTLRETFQAGDKIQRELVDLTFRFMTLAPLRPAGGMSTLTGAAQQTTERVRRWMGGMTAGRGPCGGCGGSDPARSGAGSGGQDPSATGWGPVPDNL
jgi:hypothetical protein